MHILKSFPELKISFSMSGPYGGYYRINEHFGDNKKPERFFGRFRTKTLTQQMVDELNLLADLINETNKKAKL